MKPFYQGKIDTFCALYAVLNSFLLTHSIRTLKARSLFNETLMELAKDPDLFQQVLDQTTDYFEVVDSMIELCSKVCPVVVQRPFADDAVSVDTFWETVRDWLNGRSNSSALLRFKRYITPGQAASVRHWTTIESIDEKTLHLFDSSHEADAILNLQRNRIVTSEKKVTSAEIIYVQPSSLRLLCLRGAQKK